jgi:type II secretory pathway pseudopilin PulG
MSPTPISDARRGQEGFTLAALIVILTIMSIVIAYTVPTQWSIVLKRERDRQTIFLMKQYARAIMEWQKKHQSPPTSLEQLREARKPRMIRGGEEEWPMPLTGNAEDWILVPPQALVAAVPGAPPGAPPPPPMPGAPPMATKLNKELSPPDYEGPFVAVRPRAKGKSFIALNGAESYDEWVYSVQDLQTEMMARQMALSVK